MSIEYILYDMSVLDEECFSVLFSHFPLHAMLICTSSISLTKLSVGAFMGDPENMFFAIGSVVGPHPFPMMVRDFQAIVGYEA